MKVSKDKVVSVDYTLRNAEGEVMDSSEGVDFLQYLHGHGKVIPGIEEALQDRAKGDSLKVVVPPDKAYGEHYDTMVQVVERSQFGDAPIEVGDQVEGETEVGPHLFTITQIEGDEVTVDGNHPLAGLDLHFELKVEDVREATAAELESGFPEGHEDDGGL